MNNDEQIKLLEDLAKKKLAVSTDKEEAKKLMISLGLMTKKGKWTQRGKNVCAAIAYTEANGGYKGPGQKY